MMQAFRKITDEVYYATTGITLVGPEELAFLKARAAETRRRRTRLCAHPSPESRLHEMLIVHGREAYVRPHRHHGKSESLHVVEGWATAVLFDETGKPQKRVRIAHDACRYYRIEEATFHSLLIESDWFIFHEVTAGPFDPSKTELASWAPDGEDHAEAMRYIDGLRNAA